MSARRVFLISAIVVIAVLMSGTALLALPEFGAFITIREDEVDNREPAIAHAADHDEYLVVWWNDWAGNDDIYAQRVAEDGALLTWFAVVGGPGQQCQAPAVAYSPAQGQYLIAYTYDDPTTDLDIWARLVTWHGGWMSEPFTITTDVDDQHRPAVAYNSVDDEFLVVYENSWAGGLEDIAAQRVRASDGALLSWANVATGGGSEDRAVPDVTYNEVRNQYLIAYNYWSGSDPPQIRGKVAAASLAGVSVGSEIDICCAGAGGAQQWSVAAATGPDEYFVAFTSGIIGGPVFARRLSGTGTPLGPSTGFTVTHSQYDARNPDVVYGSVFGYFVTYTTYDATWLEEVYANYVLPGRDEASEMPFGMNGGMGTRQRAPAVACTPAGECLVVTEDNLNRPSWTEGDYEIRGTFALPQRAYLPLTLRDH
jgi:hypothetical protein